MKTYHGWIGQSKQKKINDIFFYLHLFSVEVVRNAALLGLSGHASLQNTLCMNNRVAL